MRPATLADVDALGRLYRGLSATDRYHRFFSDYVPNDAALQRWVTAAERGGFRLLAILDDGSVVGDAGYMPLPDGNGEFDITVASGSRGWLGPFLLDALARAAAEHGVANLEADVLTRNRRMLSLVWARGCAVIGHEDHSVVRVVVSTGEGPPSWPAKGEGARVLVERRDGRWPAEDIARAAGLQVAVCPGPSTELHRRCPAIEGGTCPLAAAADAVVTAFPVDDERTAGLLEAHARLHPGARLFVQRPVHDSLPPGVEALPDDPHEAVPALCRELGIQVSLPNRR